MVLYYTERFRKMYEGASLRVQNALNRKVKWTSHYHQKEEKWTGAELNRRHTAFQAVALPTELPVQRWSVTR